MQENVKEALLDAIEFAGAKAISVDGQPATISDFQQLMQERLYSIADLLGMSELYLKNNVEAKS
ncbi:hypothetical protein [Enterococcus pernyi]|uniref:hypothetical protein n=1 Tax=Enterococcus pernyi TaxID=590158 RepID=UPI000789AD64|nr:hypothetical protein [Enterococcus pernyi]